MKLTINMESDDEAVDNDHAVAQLVRSVAARITLGHENGVIRDENGNKVGNWEYERTEEEDDDSERCGHSVCSQNYIDTGDASCVQDADIVHPEECPLCGGDRIEHLGALGDRQHYLCKNCGTKFSPNDD